MHINTVLEIQAEPFGEMANVFVVGRANKSAKVLEHIER